jgi:DNA gyrase inhibitor GyrI
MKQLKTSGKYTWALGILLSAFILQGCESLSFGAIYSKTSSGEIELKTIPEAVVLTTKTDGAYFDRSNQLFRRLFNYIKQNEIDMTVPVEASIDSASMTFYVGRKDRSKAEENMTGVAVKTQPERLVASLGGKGSYTRKNIDRARNKLDQWLKDQDEYRATGDIYAVYWSGPFTPGFMKRFEVHVPVERAETAAKKKEADEVADVGTVEIADAAILQE